MLIPSKVPPTPTTYALQQGSQKQKALICHLIINQTLWLISWNRINFLPISNLHCLVRLQRLPASAAALTYIAMQQASNTSRVADSVTVTLLTCYQSLQCVTKHPMQNCCSYLLHKYINLVQNAIPIKPSINVLRRLYCLKQAVQ